jgi:hypothetical protein
MKLEKSIYFEDLQNFIYFFYNNYGSSPNRVGEFKG